MQPMCFPTTTEKMKDAAHAQLSDSYRFYRGTPYVKSAFGIAEASARLMKPNIDPIAGRRRSAASDDAIIPIHHQGEPK